MRTQVGGARRARTLTVRGESLGDRRWRRTVAVTAGGLLAATAAWAVTVPVPAGATATTLYVSATGSDPANNCQSPAQPCASLTNALSQVPPGSTIEVAGIQTLTGTASTPVTPLTIEQWPGMAPAVLDGGGAESVVTVTSGSNLTLDGLEITGGQSFLGGGVQNNGGTVTIEDSTVSGNTSIMGGEGGGISSQSGTLTLIGSTVSGNVITGSNGMGGGIFSNESTLTIIGSTISDNTVQSVANNPGGTGGGIFADNETNTITESTIAGNAVTGSGMGNNAGAIARIFGTMTLTDSTVVGNSVAGGSDGGLNQDGGSSAFAGDILAGNQRNCSGPVPTDDGYDIDDDGTCTFSGTGSVSHSTTIDGYLGSLASNGGPTQTVALTSGAGNPAQAVIPANFTAPGQTTPVCSQSDQRGLLRQAPCDMGAYGLTLATVAGPPTSLGATPVNGQIDLAWSAPASTGGTPVTGYQIFRGTTSGGEGTSPVGTTTGATTWNDTSPTAGQRYYYTVRAVNAVGNSTPSTEATAEVPTPPPPTPPPTPTPAPGYWLVGGDGGVFSFGPAFFGSTGSRPLNQPVVAMASTPDGKGYWFVARDGGVFAFGDAGFHGSVPGLGEHVSDIVGIAPDPATGGYWLVGADGGVYAFGAPFHGSVPGLGQHLSDIVGIAATPDGGGYDLVASTGAVYAFGDARYQGGANALAHPVNAPIVGITVDAATGGYWLAGADGGVYAFGAPFLGSAGSEHLAQPVVGIAATPSGSGYWLVARDGGVFCFGAPFLGSMGGRHLNAPVVGLAAAG